jgi:hypothetical protein
MTCRSNGKSCVVSLNEKEENGVNLMIYRDIYRCISGKRQYVQVHVYDESSWNKSNSVGNVQTKHSQTDREREIQE